MDRSKALLFLLFGFVALSNALDSEKINGGNYASPGQFKYHVSIQRYKGKNWCGAGILADQWVVSAAHCVIRLADQNDRWPMKVVAGIQDIDYQGPLRVEADVTHVYLPRRYLSNFDGGYVLSDISLLRLKYPLNLARNQHLQKLNLPLQSKTYENEMAQIAGFGMHSVQGFIDNAGKQSETGGVTSKRLRYANSKVLSDKQCAHKFPQGKPESLLCAQIPNRQNGPEGVCGGDSGGPLVVNGDTLIGILTSSPMGCDEEKQSATYTRVSEHLKFINDIIVHGYVDGNSVHYFLVPPK